MTGNNRGGHPLKKTWTAAPSFFTHFCDSLKSSSKKKRKKPSKISQKNSTLFHILNFQALKKKMFLGIFLQVFFSCFSMVYTFLFLFIFFFSDTILREMDSSFTSSMQNVIVVIIPRPNIFRLVTPNSVYLSLQ